VKSLFDFDEQVDLAELNFDQLTERMLGCTLCRLRGSRTQVVPGEGNRNGDLLFIGEAPGEVEDRQGRPFVGPAGQLLDKVLESAGLGREQVYITNVVKCRPPMNRTPQRDEMEACWPYLQAQVRWIKPKIIIALGNIPAQFLLKRTEGITSLRGQFFRWRDGIEVFPMFHPSYLLRNPSKEEGRPKHLTWQDIQKVKERLDEFRATSPG
jgi:uracil-DNA glycosylase family 4